MGNSNNQFENLKEDLENKLLGDKLITPTQFLKAKEERRKTRKSLYTLLIKMGYLSEEDVFMFFARHAAIPFVRINDYQIDRELLSIFSEAVYREHLLLPLVKMDDVLYVCMANPLDSNLINTLGVQANLEIRPLFACPSLIQETINNFFGPDDKYFNIDDLIFSPQGSNLIGSTRESERISINIPVEFKVDDKRVKVVISSYAPATCLNISKNGKALGLKTVIFLPMQTKISIKFPVKYTNKDIAAEVIHCRVERGGQYILGIKLLGIDENLRKNILTEAGHNIS